MKPPRVHREDLRRGFSLVEVVLATLILSVILLGLHSAMLLAWRASPERGSPSSAALKAGEAIDLLSADLTYATSMIACAPAAIEFVVPDRTGDGSPDTIRYDWSGRPGDPLLRTINGSASRTVASGVTEFQLGYTKRSRRRETTYAESGEVLLSWYDGIGLLNLGAFAVDEKNWVGQSIKPLPPAGATHWRVTRAMLSMRSRGDNRGEARVQVRAADGTTPGVVLDEVPLLESTLGSGFAFKEFIFRNAERRPADSGMCLVVQWVNDSIACEVEYQALLASASNSDMIKTSNGGNSWTAPLGQDLRHYVYGTYLTASTPGYDYWLTSVSCALLSGGDKQARVLSTIRVLNEPQVSGP